ncbi:D-ribulokinase [Fusarium napiforme]|uniref:D-ribulokinase n=1 Tax=Fusarium napiforme TaxID=42672 RepID=A0A8H5JQW7_9HYPO|nr:D-ribulokinase [Fusarium napiforme]
MKVGRDHESSGQRRGLAVCRFNQRLQQQITADSNSLLKSVESDMMCRGDAMLALQAEFWQEPHEEDDHIVRDIYSATALHISRLLFARAKFFDLADALTHLATGKETKCHYHQLQCLSSSSHPSCESRSWSPERVDEHNGRKSDQERRMRRGPSIVPEEEGEEDEKEPSDIDNMASFFTEGQGYDELKEILGGEDTQDPQPDTRAAGGTLKRSSEGPLGEPAPKKPRIKINTGSKLFNGKSTKC